MRQLISNDIYYVGASDRKISLFENYIPLNYGVSYNSYLILDEKTCLLDTVDESKSTYFFKKVAETLNDRELDYLVVLHMEPDHCALINELLLRYPNTKVISNSQVFKMIKQFFNLDIKNQIVVKEGDTIKLGKHELKFIAAPMVHWPEVMFCYDTYSKTLFSADAFGSFGALSGNLFYDEVKDDNYFNEARRYYTNIVGKYGANVCNVYNKIKDLDIKMIMPLHSFLWRKDFNLLIDKYLKWATYTPEDKEVVIIYASMYGNTEEVACRLADILANKGLKNIKVYDCSKVDETVLIAEIFRVSHIVLASPTYNLAIYPKMHSLLQGLINLGVKNRTFALIENGTWAANSNKLISEELSKLKNTTIISNKVSIKSSYNVCDEQSLENLASSLVEDMKKEA